ESDAGAEPDVLADVDLAEVGRVEGEDAPAEPAAFLEQRHPAAAARQGERRANPRDAAADHCDFHEWSFIPLNFRTPSVSATSAGRRSMLDAPKKPTTPWVWDRMYCASSGSAMGPPWQSTRMSGFTAFAASHSACTRSAAWDSVSADLAPIVPFVVSPMCGISTSAPAFAIARASSSVKT